MWCLVFLITPVQAVFAEGASKGVSPWTTIFIESRLPVLEKKLFLYLDTQMRLANGGAEFSQGLIRPAIGYRFPYDIAAYLGYATFFNAQGHGEPFQLEHRIWQQGAWKWKHKPFAIGTYVRARLEQRFVAEQPGVSMRFRLMLRFDWHFHPKSPVGIGVADEFFIAFNEVPWSKSTGFTQNRLVGALYYLFEHGNRLELGYMNQLFRTSTGDLMVHVFMVRYFIFI